MRPKSNKPKTFRRKSRPRRPKTFADVTNLTGTEYYQDDNGITLSLVDRFVEDNKIFGGELLQKFYKINEGQNPLVTTLLDDKSEAIPEKVWYLVFRGNFHIRVEQHRSTGGPHCVQLWFRPFTKGEKPLWIATLQLEAFFFNEEEILAKLLEAIENREFYMTPQMREAIITP